MSEYYETNAPDLRIRTAEEKDSALIFELIKGLAAYEKMESEVVATEEMLRETIFEKKYAEVILAESEREKRCLPALERSRRNGAATGWNGGA